MSKPDLPGGESLEEILASIRKTLADERPDEGLAKLDNALPADAAPAVNGKAANGGGTFQDKLAVALDNAPNGHADEEDLTDLLASDLAPSQAPKPEADNAPGRDPLWFLSRAPAADKVTKPMPGERKEPVLPTRSEAPAARTEDIPLTRPETLRRSFPPLFGPGEVSTRSAELPLERAKPAAASDVPEKPAFVSAPLPTPAALTPEKPAAVASTVSTKPADPEARPAPATETAAILAPADPMPVKAEPAKPEPAKAEIARPEPVKIEPAIEVAAIPVARDIPAPERRAAPAAALEAMIDAEVEDTETEPAADTQGAPLQDMIARALQPVIQQWLDANLPRLVEAAIREEVSRQVKSPRGTLKI